MSAAPALGADAPPAAAASDAIARLEHARAVVEDRFLRAGEVLGAAVDGVGRLIASLERLTSALDPATVQATTGELAAAAHSLIGLPARQQERRELVQRLSGIGDGLRIAIEDMRRNLAYLRVFAINIKVASAGVEGAGADFAHFAQEISDRIEAGRKELEAFAGEAMALRAEFAAALAQERAVEDQHRGLIPAVPEGLKASAGEMAAHHQNISAVAAEVADLARDIQRQVGAGLAALQVGDSTRQRIEHVQKGLDLLDAADLPPGARAPAAGLVHRLLARQLRAAAAEFHRDADQIQRSMTRMAGHATEILRLRELAFGRSADGEGFLERMKNHLRQALELVGRMEAADLAASATGSSAAATVAALNRRITALQSIKSDVQQMALNTTLKCARIGELGKPLAVIAVELRAHAGHLDASAQETLSALARLAEDAEGLSRKSSDGDAAAALGEAVDRLGAASDSVEADLSDLASQGEAVVRTLQHAAARLDLHGEIGAALEAAASTLAEDAGAPEDPGEARSQLAALLQALSRSYTMAQEREVHAAFVASLGLGEPPPAVAAEAEQADEAVLF